MRWTLSLALENPAELPLSDTAPCLRGPSQWRYEWLESAGAARSVTPREATQPPVALPAMPPALTRAQQLLRTLRRWWRKVTR